MDYEIRHSTFYQYDYDVSLSHHVTHLTPRMAPRQECRQHRLEILPRPITQSAHNDHFANPTTFLTIEGAHRRLEIIAFSRIQVSPPPPLKPDDTAPWELIQSQCSPDSTSAPIETAEFVIWFQRGRRRN